MKDIYVKDTDDMIHLSIHIEFEGTARYVYTLPSPHAPCTEASHHPPEYPHPYDVGTGSERTSPYNKCDTWQVELVNPAEKELPYKIYFEWQQDNFPECNYTWPEMENERKGTVPAKDIVTLGDNLTFRKI